MPPKKKKQKIDFLPESIQAEILEGKKFQDQVNSFKSGLDLKKIAECARLYAKSDEVHLDYMSLVSQVFGFDVVTWTKYAIQHVPLAYNRYKSMRKECIFAIVKTLCPSKDLTEEAVAELLSFLDNFGDDAVPIGESRKCEEALLQLTKEGKWNFTKFIAPPVTECLSCGSQLSAANPPSLCTVYTLNGPKPSTKITLKCQGCKIFYGCCMYTSKGLSSYYPSHIDSGNFCNSLV